MDQSAIDTGNVQLGPRVREGTAIEETGQEMAAESATIPEIDLARLILRRYVDDKVEVHSIPVWSRCFVFVSAGLLST